MPEQKKPVQPARKPKTSSRSEPPRPKAARSPAGKPPAGGSHKAPTGKPKDGSTKPPATPAGTQGPRAQATRRKSQRPAIARREPLSHRLRKAGAKALAGLRDPQLWARARAWLPPWMDEVGALLLIVAGVVMLTALLNTGAEARLSVGLSLRLRQFFGLGAYLVALGVVAAGVGLLLPKFGVSRRLGSTRILALEVAFAAVLALLHLLANDPEPRVLAREGGGGGYVGWVLTLVPIGQRLSLVLFAALFALAVFVVSDLRLRHLLQGIFWLRRRLDQRIALLDSLDIEPRVTYGRETPRGTRDEGRGGLSSGRRPSIVPRESAAPAATPATLPPAPAASAKRRATPRPAGETAAGEVGGREPGSRPLASKARPLTKEEKREIALRIRRQHGAENGRSLVAPGEPGARTSIVPRDLLADSRRQPAPSGGRTRQAPNAAVERYFKVDDFQETKKIGKRDPGLPPLQLLSDIELNKPTEEEINTNARIIQNTLLEFDVETEVIDVNVGPTVTQYAVSPFTHTLTDEGEWVLNRVRVNEIVRLNGDLALALSARRLRIQAPVPGHSYVGIEVPNRQPSTVALRPVLESEVFYRHRDRPLALPLGRDVSGEAFVADLASMPHLLVAGTTGSGKSIMLAAMTAAFVMNNPPDRVKLILLDPKMVELMRFNGLPHLLGPVETELDRIIGVLRWATREMDRRYKLLEKEAARNIDTYNRALGRRRKDEHLPFIVIIIDEIGDLMLQRPEETERALTRLAQMARAVGMHLMVATQRPSVDVITGLIKANFPARISFAVASSVDSRVILDAVGAETLMGRGDMLFLAADAAGPRRLQGCNISDEEVAAVVDHWRDWRDREIDEGRAELPSIPPWERGMTRREVLSETDPMLEEAITLIVEEGEASASLIQRRLGLGYPRAARIIDMMHDLGIIGEAQPGGRTRAVLVKPGEDPFKRIVDRRIRRKTEGE